MVEALIRAHNVTLQTIYDQLPAPVQSSLTTMRGWFLRRIRYAPETYALLDQLQSHDQWTPKQISTYQLQALRETMKYAVQNVPFYAKYPPTELRSLEDLASLPVLARDTVRQNAERFVSRETPRRQCIRVTTTGTTGANLKVTYSRRLARQTWAFGMRQWSWAGISPLQPRITFYGSRIVPPSRTRPPYWIYNLAERQILASIFHLSERTAPDYLTFLGEHQQRILEGFPSVLGILADFLLRRGLVIPMRVVFTSGEPLYPFLRQRIEKAFQARVYDSYGMTEWCGMIHECEKGQMHLIPEYGYLEILDEDNHPVEPGKEGHLVWTSLVNKTMPLIRYRIGDRGRLQIGASCPCRRAFPLVVPTLTRESDLLYSLDGRIFSPRALNQLLKRAGSFRFCQFVQDSLYKVVVRAVSTNGNANEEVMQLAIELQTLLGNAMQVSTELAPEPVVRAGGKIPLIIQKYYHQNCTFASQDSTPQCNETETNEKPQLQEHESGIGRHSVCRTADKVENQPRGDTMLDGDSPCKAMPIKSSINGTTRSEIERELLYILGELLHANKLDLQDDFFSLGGHSLMGARLIMKIRERFGIEITLMSLFENGTVAAIATEIQRLILEQSCKTLANSVQGPLGLTINER